MARPTRWRSDGSHAVIANDMKIGQEPLVQSGALPATYFRDPNSGNRPVTSILNAPPNGLQVCISGKNAAWRRCGTIGDNDYDGAGNQNALRIDWYAPNHVISGGDSGSPLMRELSHGVAVGTVASRITAGTNLYDGVAFRAAFVDSFMSDWDIVTVSSAAAGYDDSYAARMYRNALQREPRVGDMEWWSNYPGSSQCVSRAQYMMKFFLFYSGELNGVSARVKVRRTYWTAFNTYPDQASENWWTSQLVNGTWSFEGMLNHFVYGVTHTQTTLTGTVGTQRGPC